MEPWEANSQESGRGKKDLAKETKKKWFKENQDRELSWKSKKKFQECKIRRKLPAISNAAVVRSVLRRIH